MPKQGRMKAEWRLPLRYWGLTDTVVVTAPWLKGWERWLVEARGRLDAAKAGGNASAIAGAQAAVDELVAAVTESAGGRVQ